MGIFNHTTEHNNILTIKGSDGRGFKTDQNGDYDLENKKVKNIIDGNEFIRLYAQCVYQIDRANSNFVNMNAYRKVEILYDLSNEENNATQSTLNVRPTVCTKAEKHNGRYFLKFNGSQRMISNVNLNNPVVNIFIVYKLNSRPGGYWNNGLFGHDNAGFDKFVAYKDSNLIISGMNQTNCVYFGPTASIQTFLKLAGYSVNDLGALNVWHCLSIHWDNLSSPKTHTSKIYWNKKHIGDFTAKKFNWKYTNNIW